MSIRLTQIFGRHVLAPSPSDADDTPLRPSSEAVPHDLIELLFFAYRDFVGDPDRILADYGSAAPITASCTSSSAGRA